METHDIVLAGNRVLDPESDLDAILNIGIQGRKIFTLSAKPLHGKTEIDTAGLVAVPGFIDINSHGQTDENYRYQAMDGVTTALELEIGASPIDEWYMAREGKALINFGASAGHIPARMRIMNDSGEYLPRDAAMNRCATAEEKRAILELIQIDLDAGGLGLGLGLAYTPTATPEEILDVFYGVEMWRRPVYVHMRYGGNGTPGIFEALQEVITDSIAAGLPIHIMHINSMAQRKTPQALRIIEGARARNLDVTTEAYPYIAGASSLESALFDQGWQDTLGADYPDLMWVATGERLTRESFERYRKQGGRVIIFGNSEEALRSAIAHPLVIIASDGRTINGRGHPRGVGSFARVLGKYVREEGVIPLMEAVRKCSLMPAKRLEAVSPQMRQKGRIKVGADADIAVFDPDRVIDRATFEDPARFSEGFHQVLVGGTFVVRDGELQGDVFPGLAIRA